MSKGQKHELFDWGKTNNRGGPPSKKPRYSREEETRTLVSKLVAKELGELKKAEKKEEVKGQELKNQIMDILKEAKSHPSGNVSGASASSESSTSTTMLRGILKKSGQSLDWIQGPSAIKSGG